MDSPTAYRYDLPEAFRNQVIHIWRDGIGYRNDPLQFDVVTPFILGVYHSIDRSLSDAIGHPGITVGNPCDDLYTFFRKADTKQALIAIEVRFSAMCDAQSRKPFMIGLTHRLGASDAVTKLNTRFQEHAIGYRLERGRIVRVDSEFLHAEVVQPAIELMQMQGYEGAFQEFMLAQKYYLQGSDHYDDCLTNCGKALESTLKTICDRRQWVYKVGDTALKLLDLVFSKELIPNYLQTHYGGLRATLEGGVPTIRNREGGHGSGEKPNEVPEYLAAYQIHLTASAIVFLIRANESYTKPNP